VIASVSKSLRSVPAWRWWYSGPVVVGNVGDNSVSSYRLYASETQQLSYVADATPICYLRGGARGKPSTRHGPTCNTPQRLRRRLRCYVQCLVTGVQRVNGFTQTLAADYDDTGVSDGRPKTPITSVLATRVFFCQPEAHWGGGKPSEYIHCVPKRPPFYVLNNSVKNKPILMIFDVLNPEKILHVRCSHFTLENPKKSFSTVLFIHIVLIIYVMSPE